MLKYAISILRSLLGRWTETDPSVRRKRLVIALLIVLHILPLWVFKYFPTQDGPAHVYNSYVLSAFHDEESTLLREYHKLNLRLFPNWSSHAFMSLLMKIFPPLIAEKIHLSAIISLLPLSLFYFVGAVHKGKNLYGFVGFLFSDHYLLHMGFYSFALSVPLFFFALGYFMKHKEDLSLNKIAILNLLCILIYFSHILSYLLLILSLTLLSITSFYRRPKRVMALLVSMLPLYFIMANYLLSNVVADNGHLHLRWERFSDWKAWDYFLSIKSLMFFTDAHLIPTRILAIMLGLLFAVTLYKRIRERRIMSQDNQFLLIFGVFTVLYFIMPGGMASGGFINYRVNLFIIPVLLPFLSEDYHKYIKRGIIIIIVILSVARLSISCRYYYSLDKITKEYTSGVELIERNKTVLGLWSDARPGVKDPPPFTHQPYHHVRPFVQASSYYCLSNNCVSLSNYEPQFDYFPLDWRIKHSGAVDYIVAWKMDKSKFYRGGGPSGVHVREIIDSLDTDYELIHSTENLQVYRHRAEQPNRVE